MQANPPNFSPRSSPKAKAKAQSRAKWADNPTWSKSPALGIKNPKNTAFVKRSADDTAINEFLESIGKSDANNVYKMATLVNLHNNKPNVQEITCTKIGAFVKHLENNESFSMAANLKSYIMNAASSKKWQEEATDTGYAQRLRIEKEKSREKIEGRSADGKIDANAIYDSIMLSIYDSLMNIPQKSPSEKPSPRLGECRSPVACNTAASSTPIIVAPLISNVAANAAPKRFPLGSRQHAMMNSGVIEKPILGANPAAAARLQRHYPAPANPTSPSSSSTSSPSPGGCTFYYSPQEFAMARKIKVKTK